MICNCVGMVIAHTNRRIRIRVNDGHGIVNTTQDILGNKSLLSPKPLSGWVLGTVIFISHNIPSNWRNRV